MATQVERRTNEFCRTDNLHWECYLLLWNISSDTSPFEVTNGDITYLAWLVEVYLETFKQLYDVNINTKSALLDTFATTNKTVSYKLLTVSCISY